MYCHPAIASGLEYSSPMVIPMFPSGTLGLFKNSMTIQRVTAGLSDGITEVFARVRRDIGRVRSPTTCCTIQLLLEFGEEDEGLYHRDGGTSPRDDGGSMSASPSSGVVDTGDPWSSWAIGDPTGEGVEE